MYDQFGWVRAQAQVLVELGLELVRLFQAPEVVKDQVGEAGERVWEAELWVGASSMFPGIEGKARERGEGPQRRAQTDRFRLLDFGNGAVFVRVCPTLGILFFIYIPKLGTLTTAAKGSERSASESESESPRLPRYLTSRLSASSLSMPS